MTDAVVVVATPGTVLVVASPARGPAGPPGPPGPAGSSQYTHTQLLPATVWTVQHNLGRRPAAASVFSADYTVEFGGFAVQHVDLNTLYLSADLPISGVALVT